MVRNDVYKSTWAGVPTKGYFLALCIIINATFAILQIFVVNKATSVDRSFNLNSVLWTLEFSYNYHELPASEQVKKCNYSGSSIKQGNGRLSINCQWILAVGCSVYIS